MPYSKTRTRAKYIHRTSENIGWVLTGNQIGDWLELQKQRYNATIPCYFIDKLIQDGVIKE